MSKAKDIPVYLNLVETVQAGFSALDLPVQKEINEFVKSQQDNSGAFVDRAGQPDLYYSLFGLWISQACNQQENKNSLKEFVVDKNTSDSTSPVEDLALLLIKSELERDFKKKGVLSIIRNVMKKGRMIELSYQFFLISLVIDAVGKNKKLYYFFARIWLRFYKPKGELPCSIYAALTFARRFLGLKTKAQEDQLKKYAVESGGFRSFFSIETADMLSTGVALFVLKENNFDVRLLAPASLDFIQGNYTEGAFLSGDGDMTKDLEYTFYGLLALGSLMN